MALPHAAMWAANVNLRWANMNSLTGAERAVRLLRKLALRNYAAHLYMHMHTV